MYVLLSTKSLQVFKFICWYFSLQTFLEYLHSTHTMTIFRPSSEFPIRRISFFVYYLPVFIPIFYLISYLSAKVADGRVVFAIFDSYYDVFFIMYFYFVSKRRRNYKRMGLLMCSTSTTAPDTNTTSDVDTKGCEIL